MRIKQYLSEDALEKLQEVIDYDIPEYAGDRHYGDYGYGKYGLL